MDDREELFCEAPPDIAAATRLDAWLAAATGLSRERVKKLIAAGCVRDAVSGSVATGGSQRVAPRSGWQVSIPRIEPAKIEAQDIPLSVIYDDESIAVIDKPPGLVVHPAAGHADNTLVNAVLHRYPGVFGVGGEERPGIVHRLDKDTSGLIVVAKTDAALAALGDGFRNGSVRKTYLAIACGVPDPPSGHVENMIGRSRYDRKKMAVVDRGGKFASTDWEVAEDFGSSALVRLRIHTGRTHQIRVHLASFGCPVAGDAVYGSARADSVLPFRPARQMLHAARIAFPHPASGREMVLTAPLPPDFGELLAALRTATRANCGSETGGYG